MNHDWGFEEMGEVRCVRCHASTHKAGRYCVVWPDAIRRALFLWQYLRMANAKYSRMKGRAARW